MDERASRALCGGVAGAAAAALWALQQPIDQRVFRCAFDDVELLGKALTRGPRWRLVGTALHLLNGAAFGALYANLAPRARCLPGWSRGPAAALGEHLLSWPAVAITDRLHPARAELPVLSGSRSAFAQATWRHLLFGAVLGAGERHLRGRHMQDGGRRGRRRELAGGTRSPVGPTREPV